MDGRNLRLVVSIAIKGFSYLKNIEPTDLGICQQSNGFYIDSSGKTQFSDVNGDGNNELFDVDDDDDGYLDFADAFPLDATEWLDSDGDGLGDNADVFPSDATETVDSDGDGVGDNKDAFPNDSSEHSIRMEILSVTMLMRSHLMLANW